MCNRPVERVGERNGGKERTRREQRGGKRRRGEKEKGREGRGEKVEGREHPQLVTQFCLVPGGVSLVLRW